MIPFATIFKNVDYKAKMAMRPARPAPAILTALALAAPGVSLVWAAVPVGEPEEPPDEVADSAPERAEEAAEETAPLAALAALEAAPEAALAAEEATAPAAPWKLVWVLGKRLAKQSA